MKRELPNALKERQEKQRNESIKRVNEAIKELKEEGQRVTIKLLVDRTGLSRATLSKSHIEEVLKKNRVCKFERRMCVEHSSTIDINELELEISNLQSKLEKSNKELAKVKNRNNKLKLENYELKEKNKKLLGELQMVSKKSRMHGVRLELIKNED